MEKIEHKVSIPVDLVIEIFSRVPAKSIARFCCVSKSWRSILRHPDFTDLFLTKSSSRPRLLFTFEVNKEFFAFSSPQPQNPEVNSCVVATRYSAPFPKYVPSDRYSESNVVCGLVFRHALGERKVHVICNNATGEFMTLPRVKRKSHPKAEAVCIKKFCFGYDPIEKQHKVLCMTSSNIHRVLTLKNGKRLWRWIESDIPFYENYIIDGEICINGFLYFESASFHGSSMIVCFDVRSEKLSIVKINKRMLLEISGRSSSTLINYKGKLGVYVEFYIDFVLWVLEDAQNHKWSRYTYKLPPPDPYNNGLCIVGMTGAGEIVWSPDELKNPFYVLYFSPERNTFTRVDVQGFEEFMHGRIGIHTFIDYVEDIKFYM